MIDRRLCCRRSRVSQGTRTCTLEPPFLTDLLLALVDTGTVPVHASTYNDIKPFHPDRWQANNLGTRQRHQNGRFLMKKHSTEGYHLVLRIEYCTPSACSITRVKPAD